MKIIYNNAELQHNNRSYNTLINRPSLNGHTLQGNVSLDTLSLYDKPTVRKLVDATSQIRLVTSMPADPEANMTYYVGPDEKVLYDVILVDDAKTQIPMGTTQFGQYKSGPGVNVKFDNTINVNTDDVSVYIDSEGNIASSLDGNALQAFTGATTSAAGTKGIVPKPVSGEQNSVLFGNSTWKAFSDIIDLIHPVGSLFITYTSTAADPNNLFSGTTWEALTGGYVLWNDTDGGGGTISAAIPNIKGTLGVNFLTHCAGNVETDWSTTSGCLKFTHNSDQIGSWPTGGSDSSPYGKLEINFSKGNSIYGNSSTVQPPVTRVVVWKRTA